MQVTYRLFRCPGSCGMQQVAPETATVWCGQRDCRAIQMKPGRKVKGRKAQNPVSEQRKTGNGSKPTQKQGVCGSEKPQNPTQPPLGSRPSEPPMGQIHGPLSEQMWGLASRTDPVGEAAWRTLIGLGAVQAVAWGEWVTPGKPKPIRWIGSELPTPLTKTQLSELVAAWLSAQDGSTVAVPVTEIASTLAATETQIQAACEHLVNEGRITVVRPATGKRPMTVQVHA